jgi:hypothetical protein
VLNAVAQPARADKRSVPTSWRSQRASRRPA